MAANPHIRMIIVNDPTNPTGAKWTRTELTALANILKQDRFKHIVIVSDETYGDLVFNDEPMWLHVADEELAKRTVCIFTGAKCLGGAPSLRAGITLIIYLY